MVCLIYSIIFVQMDKRVKKSLRGEYLYYPQDVIGEGGYAVVYKGEKISTKSTVAIKKISFDRIPDDYAYSAVNNEIRILKNLKDDHIIKSEEIVQSKTEYADGGNLQNFLNTHKQLEEKRIIKYITQIVCGLGVLVKNGITHRDLKPSNILIVNGKLKLADFGLSRFSEISQKMLSRVGTQIYMSPEILRRVPYTSKCDIWSLGVLCYEMAVGPVPWNSTEKKNGLIEHIRMIKDFLAEDVFFPPNCKISDELKGFIRGCLKFEESKRFGWMEVFLHKIFKGKFKNSIYQQESFTPKFCLSRLRQSIHLQNINIEQLLLEIPDEIDQETFKFLTKVVDEGILEQEAEALFKEISQNSENIDKNKLSEILKKNGVRMKGESLENLQKMSGKFQTSKKLSLLLEGLSKKLQARKLDLFEMFQEKNSHGLSSISSEKFNEIILKIDPEFPQQFFPDLFPMFDINKDGKISYEELYSQFCKVAQMIVIRDKNMMDSFRKMVMTKNKKSTDKMTNTCK